MAEKNYIYIKKLKVKVQVREVVYQEHRRFINYEQYLQKKDMKNGLILYSNLDNERLLSEEMLIDRDQPSTEEHVERKILIEKLRKCLDMLPDGERELIKALFYDNLSEREISKKTGLHNMTIHNRKVKILKKLKKLMEK